MPTAPVAAAALAAAFAAALGSGVVAGVFFAFSSFVMRALARLPDADGAAAMRAINVAAPNSLFLGVLLGTGALSAALVAAAAVRPGAPGAAPLAAGGVLYLANVAVTVVRNVPLNDALARGAPDDAALWRRYRARWTAWNHVRAAAALAAALAFTLALRAEAAARAGGAAGVRAAPSALSYASGGSAPRPASVTRTRRE